MGKMILGSAIGSVVMLGLCLFMEKNPSSSHHVSSPAVLNDPTRARLVSYTDDGTLVYWADIPVGTTEIQITVDSARSVRSVHVDQITVMPAMTIGGLYCKSNPDGSCK